MELDKKIKAAVDANQDLYWRLMRNWLELRAITYTWETGNVRTKLVEIYNLKEQLDKVVETQKALGINAPKNFFEELEPAYWNKVIDIHPRKLISKEVASGQ